MISLRRLLFLFIVWIFVGCKINDNRYQREIDIVGSWEGFDTSMQNDSKIILQFQSDSLFQEFGFYEGEWKTRGVWDLYELNGKHYIRLVYEDNKFEKYNAEIIFYSRDSMLIDLGDELHSDIFSLKRSRFMDGEVVYYNPIFKLKPHQMNDEEPIAQSSTSEINTSTNTVIVPTLSDNQEQKTVYVTVRPMPCSYCKPSDDEGWYITDFDINSRTYPNGRYILRPGYKPCSICYGTGKCQKKYWDDAPGICDENYTCLRCHGDRFQVCEHCHGSGFSN